MAQESAFEFVARLQKDGRFRRQYAEAKVNCQAGVFLTEMGFNFNVEELEAARRKLRFNPRDREMVRELMERFKGNRGKIEPEAALAAISGCNAPPPSSYPRECYRAPGRPRKG